jgi:AraC-like DNA-binding protein
MTDHATTQYVLGLTATLPVVISDTDTINAKREDSGYGALSSIHGGSDGGQFLLKHPHPHTTIDRRDHTTIARLGEEDWTLGKVAERCGVSRQRIHQILKRRGEKSAQQGSPSGSWVGVV